MEILISYLLIGFILALLVIRYHDSKFLRMNLYKDEYSSMFMAILFTWIAIFSIDHFIGFLSA